MSFLDRAIRDGVRSAMSNAIGKAVKGAIEPKATQLVNRATNRLDSAAADVERQGSELRGREGAFDQSARELEGALGNLQRSMQGYATELAKNLKTCPACGESATAEKKFCPNCGAKLPEQTLAQGAVCPNCARQNAIGTRFCQDCGTKLPTAVAEEQAHSAGNAAALARWGALLPEYPEWKLGGRELTLERGDGYVCFSAEFYTKFEAMNAVERYRALLRQEGFREAGLYPDRAHLYKRVGGKCCHVDSEHLFEGGEGQIDLYFINDEPEGGFDYEKPSEQSPRRGLFF